jgi:hypothetical protein
MDTNSDASINKKTHSKTEAMLENSSSRKHRPRATGKAYEAKDESQTQIFSNNAGEGKRHDCAMI